MPSSDNAKRFKLMLDLMQTVGPLWDYFEPKSFKKFVSGKSCDPKTVISDLKAFLNDDEREDHNLIKAALEVVTYRDNMSKDKVKEIIDLITLSELDYYYACGCSLSPLNKELLSFAIEQKYRVYFYRNL